MRPHTDFFKQGVADLRRILKGSLRIVDVAEELASCKPSDNAEAVRAEMRKRSFDVMGYEVDERIVGYVCVENLRSGTCKTYQKPLDPSSTIDAHGPILTLLSRLKNRRWLFIAVKDEVKGIVTLADLQKTPVRMALFGLVSLLEIHSLSMVRTCCPCEIDIEQGLKDRRLLDDAKKHYKQMQERREDIDLAACLLLPAKTRLLCAIPSLPEFLGFRNVGHAKKVFTKATDLRNNLVHGRDVVDGASWPDAIEVVEQVEQVLHHYEANREEFERQFGDKQIENPIRHPIHPVTSSRGHGTSFSGSIRERQMLSLLHCQPAEAHSCPSGKREKPLAPARRRAVIAVKERSGWPRPPAPASRSAKD